MGTGFSLTIGAGENGITYALKRHIDEQIREGNMIASDGRITRDEWENAIDKLADIERARNASGGDSIFNNSGLDKKDYTKNFIVHTGQTITFTDAELADIYSALGVEVTKKEPVVPQTPEEGNGTIFEEAQPTPGKVVDDAKPEDGEYKITFKDVVRSTKNSAVDFVKQLWQENGEFSAKRLLTSVSVVAAFAFAAPLAAGVATALGASTAAATAAAASVGGALKVVAIGGAAFLGGKGIKGIISGAKDMKPAYNKQEKLAALDKITDGGVDTAASALALFGLCRKPKAPNNPSPSGEQGLLPPGPQGNQGLLPAGETPLALPAGKTPLALPPANTAALPAGKTPLALPSANTPPALPPATTGTTGTVTTTTTGGATGTGSRYLLQWNKPSNPSAIDLKHVNHNNRQMVKAAIEEQPTKASVDSYLRQVKGQNPTKQQQAWIDQNNAANAAQRAELNNVANNSIGGDKLAGVRDQLAAQEQAVARQQAAAGQQATAQGASSSARKAPKGTKYNPIKGKDVNRRVKQDIKARQNQSTQAKAGQQATAQTPQTKVVNHGGVSKTCTYDSTGKMVKIEWVEGGQTRTITDPTKLAQMQYKIDQAAA